MLGRRARRFLVEVAFLAALAAALAFADLRPLYVGAMMLLGWLLVSIYEWASLRAEPHWGSGTPPRYYVPRVRLPPSLPLERPDPRFPLIAVREAQTWLLPPPDEEEDWPRRPEPAPGPPLEDTSADERFEPAAATLLVEPEPEPEPDAEPPAASEAELEAEPEQEPEPEREPVAVPAAVRTARHRVDPLETSRGRWRRRRDENAAMIEVPARPIVRVLPGASRRED